MSEDKKIESELIRIASVLVQCNYLPSTIAEDYPQKTYPSLKVAKMMEEAHNNSKKLALGIREEATKISALRQQLEKKDQQINNWTESARMFLDNQKYYSGLLDEIAKNFGKDAYISYDGSIQDSPLRAKMPELVIALRARAEQAEAKLAAVKEQLRLANIDVFNTKAELAELRERLKGIEDFYNAHKQWFDDQLNPEERLGIFFKDLSVVIIKACEVKK